MPPTNATTRIRKKDGDDGTLTLPAKQDYLYWTPLNPPKSTPTVTIPVKDIVNVQATPATAKGIALKVILADGAHTFHFTHPQNARQELESMRNAVAEVIRRDKADENALPPAQDTSASGTPVRNGTTQGKPAAMAIAKAVASQAEEEQWYDDAKLKRDVELQQSLFKASPELEARFKQAMKEKPASVSMSQFTSQFWGTRLHLLRAHAVEKQQKPGVYNVLPEIKFIPVPPDPEDSNGQWSKRLQITKEQIKLMFKHYPVLMAAYDELTTQGEKPLAPGTFWELFFQSRLLKKLKGEKILDTDVRGPLDKYLDMEEKRAERKEDNPLKNAGVPTWMNLAANDQNHSQRKGNLPDLDMRPSDNTKAPVLRVLNSLSEKLMAHIPPEDSEAHGPIGMDEETFDQLRLQDLARQDVDNRVVLKIREQQRFAGGNSEDLSAQAKLYAQQDPEKVLALLRSELQPSNLGANEQGTLKLDQAIGYHTDDSSDSEGEDDPQTNGGGTPLKKKKVAARIGSHAAMTTATTDILYSIKQSRQAASADPKSLNGLSQNIFDNLTLTHNTTTEFLHYFWSIFLSGDAARANELAQLVASLDNSMARLNAVGDAAEKEREQIIARMREDDRIYFERTKRRKYKAARYEQVAGGRKAVMEMVRPTLDALRRANEAYREAFEEATREAAAVGTAV